MLVEPTAELAEQLKFHPRAGLLYPGPAARLLSDVSAAERPAQLVILDGTWHHAKTLLRDIPALARLPRFRLAPATQSRYRIRREPTAIALSTVEATVAALRVLEPETAGLDQLLAAFDYMIDRQLAQPRTGYATRRNTSRRRGCGNIPRALLADPRGIVVAYGESTAGGSDRLARPQPIYWVAQRLGTGERFGCRIQPRSPLDDALLGHLELSRGDFASALPMAAARAAWNSFVRPGDIVAVYNQGTRRLLDELSGTPLRSLLLKGIHLRGQRRYSTLDDLISGEGLTPAPAEHPGRAGKRLANAIALVRHLIALGQRRAAGERVAP
ncbi:MAG: DTW domain-containing protein [Planctomycetaceae bacterium]|nr:DTW domain-containing protein [Planctomycetaceae bacterium]